VYYFGYCTFLWDPERAKWLPEAKLVTQAVAPNHEIQFRLVFEGDDRGQCHITNTIDAYGKSVRGLVFEVDEHHIYDPFEGFDTIFLTVHGDDGKAYDCYTLRLTNPGEFMKPPRYYWDRIRLGMENSGFPEDYQNAVKKMFEDCPDCPDFERPEP
jgi:hypothetical protein